MIVQLARRRVRQTGTRVTVGKTKAQEFAVGALVSRDVGPRTLQKPGLERTRTLAWAELELELDHGVRAAHRPGGRASEPPSLHHVGGELPHPGAQGDGGGPSRRESRRSS
eukprot:911746-Rhodomonas_salina.1